jgi:L-histidine N-alpha-methyltransferase
VKTTILLDALPELERFVAVDIDENALEAAGRRLAARYPALEVIGVVGDFERRLPDPYERTLVVCLGSTIGGLEPEDRARVLAAVAHALAAEGALLLGLDLIKPVERLAAAYDVDDAPTAGLIANVLHVLDRELGADFRPAAFRSESAWNPDLERMEMFVRAQSAETVTLPAIDLTVEFAAGEAMRTEISTKFTRESAACELAAAGLGIDAWWTDDAGDFALCLARPVPQSGDAA